MHVPRLGDELGVVATKTPLEDITIVTLWKERDVATPKIGGIVDLQT